MSRVQFVRALLGVSAVVAAVLTLAGCGGDGDTAVGGAAAGVVPANVALYATLNTDFEGDEWQQAEELVRRFPDGDRAIRELLATIEAEDDLDFEEDVKPALGPEVALVVSDFAAADPGVVGLTQPRDQQKFEELLAQGDAETVSQEFEGWTVFSDEQASIDAFVQAAGGDTLADSDEFAEALDGLDAGLLSLYVSGEGLRRAAEQDPSFDPESVGPLLPNGEFPTLGVTLGAEDDAGWLDGQFVFGGDVAESGFVGEPFAAELPEEVPGEVLAYVGFSDLEQQFSRFRDALAEYDPSVESQLGQLEGALGVSLEEDIAPLFAGEGAFYVRRGAPLPELTLVTNVENEQQAVGTVDDLVEGLGGFVPVPPPEDTEIAGVSARQLVLEPPVTLFYAAFDGKLVVTTTRDGIADLREEGERLSDDDAYNDALEQAEMPDETTGFAYVDLGESVPLLLDFAGAGGESIPPEVRANTEPLRGLVAYGTAEDEKVTFSAFLGVE
jgi:hypothetical protein